MQILSKESKIKKIKEVSVRVSPLSLYRFYYPDIKMGLQSSPIRVDDKPSFALYIKEDDLLWWDNSEGIGGKVWDLLMADKGYRYSDVIDMIYADLPRIQANPVPMKAMNPTIIKIAPQDYTSVDVAYWSAYGIDVDQLAREKVYSCSSVVIDKSVWYYDDEDPIYAYEYTCGYKIYRPLGETKVKWRTSSNILHDLHPALGIIKAKKDEMVMYNLTGHQHWHVKSETQTLTKDMNEIIKAKYLMYDNDAAGIKAAKKTSKVLGIPYLVPPLKDISDTIKVWGKERTQEWLRESLQQIGVEVTTMNGNLEKSFEN